MTFSLTEKQRNRHRGMVRRPRSRKQLFRDRALLALGEGQPVEAVARTFKVGVDRVEAWVDAFRRLGIDYLDEPQGPGPKARQEGPDDEPEDEE